MIPVPPPSSPATFSVATVRNSPAEQTLEQQLEEMRATYQLNTEKLEYNYRVLTERDMENSATLSHQKRKLTKLKDALSGLVQVGMGSGYWYITARSIIFSCSVFVRGRGKHGIFG